MKRRAFLKGVTAAALAGPLLLKSENKKVKNSDSYIKAAVLVADWRSRYIVGDVVQMLDKGLFVITDRRVQMGIIVYTLKNIEYDVSIEVVEHPEFTRMGDLWID